MVPSDAVESAGDPRPRAACPACPGTRALFLRLGLLGTWEGGGEHELKVLNEPTSDRTSATTQQVCVWHPACGFLQLPSGSPAADPIVPGRRRTPGGRALVRARRGVRWWDLHWWVPALGGTRTWAAALCTRSRFCLLSFVCGARRARAGCASVRKQDKKGHPVRPRPSPRRVSKYSSSALRDGPRVQTGTEKATGPPLKGDTWAVYSDDTSVSHGSTVVLEAWLAS